MGRAFNPLSNHRRRKQRNEPTITNQSSKQIHVTGVKRGKTRASKSLLVLGLLLIGSDEIGTKPHSCVLKPRKLFDLGIGAEKKLYSRQGWKTNLIEGKPEKKNLRATFTQGINFYLLRLKKGII